MDNDPTAMRIHWCLRILAVAGLAISLYLLILKLTGRISYVVGCGEGSGCANVLGSRWSQFFHVPVTAFAAAMYATLLVATWRREERTGTRSSDTERPPPPKDVIERGSDDGR